MRETRGLEERVLALLMGQVRGRVCTDLEIWVMGSSPTASSAPGLSLTKEVEPLPQVHGRPNSFRCSFQLITLSLVQL